MTRISRRSRNRTENKRYGHKQARQATRHVLEDGGNPRMAHGAHWSPTIEQPPLNDEAVMGPPPPKKQGCKRNKYGPHIIQNWPTAPTYMRVLNPETEKMEWQTIPYWRRSYHPPYRCKVCKKGFYKIPRNAVQDQSAIRTSMNNWENEVQDDHWDLWNIRARLLGIACRCVDCREDS